MRGSTGELNYSPVQSRARRLSTKSIRSGRRWDIRSHFLSFFSMDSMGTAADYCDLTGIAATLGGRSRRVVTGRCPGGTVWVPIGSEPVHTGSRPSRTTRAAAHVRVAVMKRFHSFRLDSVNQCLWRGEHRVPITPRAFDVLRYLVEHAGRLVTQDGSPRRAVAGDPRQPRGRQEVRPDDPQGSRRPPRRIDLHRDDPPARLPVRRSRYRRDGGGSVPNVAPDEPDRRARSGANRAPPCSR